MKKRFLIASILVIFVLLVAILTAILWRDKNHRSQKNHTNKNNAANSVAVSIPDYHFDIALIGGKLNGKPITYEVRAGKVVEFRIDSDTFGKLGVPTRPTFQTIAFTSSPLIFQFPVPDAGSFNLTFEANGSNNVILIGVLHVLAK